ncbi:hypothetical protein BESB_076900 [Besnoitia besnoiti]|uniref:Uncharacterized protein n=1 Tax=Besnoitia besnoiti TaxID=94643 RepID=A0A2A9MCT0_BESBE|nr:hypothetical protein BESB_076900 [Besnoitia besnoiti]PFH33473.1 hypothetical protein BESB_076900 [Besnoitia besnoiti]
MTSRQDVSLKDYQPWSSGGAELCALLLKVDPLRQATKHVARMRESVRAVEDLLQQLACFQQLLLTELRFKAKDIGAFVTALAHLGLQLPTPRSPRRTGPPTPTHLRELHRRLLRRLRKGELRSRAAEAPEAVGVEPGLWREERESWSDSTDAGGDAGDALSDREREHAGLLAGDAAPAPRIAKPPRAVGRKGRRTQGRDEKGDAWTETSTPVRLSAGSLSARKPTDGASSLSASQASTSSSASSSFSDSGTTGADRCGLAARDRAPLSSSLTCALSLSGGASGSAGSRASPLLSEGFEPRTDEEDDASRWGAGFRPSASSSPSRVPLSVASSPPLEASFSPLRPARAPEVLGFDPLLSPPEPAPSGRQDEARREVCARHKAAVEKTREGEEVVGALGETYGAAGEGQIATPKALRQIASVCSSSPSCSASSAASCEAFTGKGDSRPHRRRQRLLKPPREPSVPGDDTRLGDRAKGGLAGAEEARDEGRSEAAEDEDFACVLWRNKARVAKRRLVAADSSPSPACASPAARQPCSTVHASPALSESLSSASTAVASSESSSSSSRSSPNIQRTRKRKSDASPLAFRATLSDSESVVREDARLGGSRRGAKRRRLLQSRSRSPSLAGKTLPAGSERTTLSSLLSKARGAPAQSSSREDGKPAFAAVGDPSATRESFGVAKGQAAPPPASPASGSSSPSASDQGRPSSAAAPAEGESWPASRRPAASASTAVASPQVSSAVSTVSAESVTGTGVSGAGRDRSRAAGPPAGGAPLRGEASGAAETVSGGKCAAASGSCKSAAGRDAKKEKGRSGAATVLLKAREASEAETRAAGASSAGASVESESSSAGDDDAPLSCARAARRGAAATTSLGRKTNEISRKLKLSAASPSLSKRRRSAGSLLPGAPAGLCPAKRAPHEANLPESLEAAVVANRTAPVAPASARQPLENAGSEASPPNPRNRRGSSGGERDEKARGATSAKEKKSRAVCDDDKDPWLPTGAAPARSAACAPGGEAAGAADSTKCAGSRPAAAEEVRRRCGDTGAPRTGGPRDNLAVTSVPVLQSSAGAPPPLPSSSPAGPQGSAAKEARPSVSAPARETLGKEREPDASSPGLRADPRTRSASPTSSSESEAEMQEAESRSKRPQRLEGHRTPTRTGATASSAYTAECLGGSAEKKNDAVAGGSHARGNDDKKGECDALGHGGRLASGAIEATARSASGGAGSERPRPAPAEGCQATSAVDARTPGGASPRKVSGEEKPSKSAPVCSGAATAGATSTRAEGVRGTDFGRGEARPAERGPLPLRRSHDREDEMGSRERERTRDNRGWARVERGGRDDAYLRRPLHDDRASHRAAVDWYRGSGDYLRGRDRGRRTEERSPGWKLHASVAWASSPKASTSYLPLWVTQTIRSDRCRSFSSHGSSSGHSVASRASLERGDARCAYPADDRTRRVSRREAERREGGRGRGRSPSAHREDGRGLRAASPRATGRAALGNPRCREEDKCWWRERAKGRGEDGRELHGPPFVSRRPDARSFTDRRWTQSKSFSSSGSLSSAHPSPPSRPSSHLSSASSFSAAASSRSCCTMASVSSFSATPCTGLAPAIVSDPTRGFPPSAPAAPSASALASCPAASLCSFTSSRGGAGDAAAEAEEGEIAEDGEPVAGSPRSVLSPGDKTPQLASSRSSLNRQQAATTNSHLGAGLGRGGAGIEAPVERGAPHAEGVSSSASSASSPIASFTSSSALAAPMLRSSASSFDSNLPPRPARPAHTQFPEYQAAKGAPCRPQGDSLSASFCGAAQKEQASSLSVCDASSAHALPPATLQDFENVCESCPSSSVLSSSSVGPAPLRPASLLTCASSLCATSAASAPFPLLSVSPELALSQLSSLVRCFSASAASPSGGATSRRFGILSLSAQRPRDAELQKRRGSARGRLPLGGGGEASEEGCEESEEEGEVKEDAVLLSSSGAARGGGAPEKESAASAESESKAPFSLFGELRFKASSASTTPVRERRSAAGNEEKAETPARRTPDNLEVEQTPSEVSRRTPVTRTEKAEEEREDRVEEHEGSGTHGERRQGAEGAAEGCEGDRNARDEADAPRIARALQATNDHDAGAAAICAAAGLDAREAANEGDCSGETAAAQLREASAEGEIGGISAGQSGSLEAANGCSTELSSAPSGRATSVKEQREREDGDGGCECSGGGGSGEGEDAARKGGRPCVFFSASSTDNGEAACREVDDERGSRGRPEVPPTRVPAERRKKSKADGEEGGRLKRAKASQLLLFHRGRGEPKEDARVPNAETKLEGDEKDECAAEEMPRRPSPSETESPLRGTAAEEMQTGDVADREEHGQVSRASGEDPGETGPTVGRLAGSPEESERLEGSEDFADEQELQRVCLTLKAELEDALQRADSAATRRLLVETHRLLVHQMPVSLMLRILKPTGLGRTVQAVVRHEDAALVALARRIVTALKRRIALQAQQGAARI